MLQKRIAIFYGGATIAGQSDSFHLRTWVMLRCSPQGAFSGLLAFGISYMSGIDGLLGWSWIFVRDSYPISHHDKLNSWQIIEGLATVVVGVVAIFG